MSSPRLSESEFLELAYDALDALPDRFHDQMDNVVVDVEPVATPHHWSLLNNPQRGPAPVMEGVLLGLFSGVPLPAQSAGVAYPNRVWIFQRSIESFCHTHEDLRELVRRVVWHEIGHHFGFSDADMKEFDEAPLPSQK